MRYARRARRRGGSGTVERIRTIAVLVGLAIVLAVPAQAERASSAPNWEEVGAKAFDVLVLRPIGVARLAMGAVLWVPVTAIWPPLYAENYQQFIGEPAEYLIQRQVGEDFAGG